MTKASDPKLFKLTSGDIVVTDIASDNVTTYKLADPLLLAIQNGPNGPQVTFVPFMMFAEDGTNITLHKHAVVTGPDTPDKELVENYKTVTNKSTIIQPRKTGIIL